MSQCPWKLAPAVSTPPGQACRHRLVIVQLLAAGLSVLLAGLAVAQTGEMSPDKSRYHLFNPTPAALLRDLESDRPDRTESPITVDAGHFQVEADLVSYAYTQRQGVRQDDLMIPTLNLKLGVLNRVDLQTILIPYGRTRIQDRTVSPAMDQTCSGFGDMQVRAKINLWGNDGGRSALAMMPFIHLPTGAPGLTTDAVEGGVIFPFGFDLPAGFYAGAMWEVDWIRNADNSRYHAESIQTLTIGRNLTRKLSAYVEFWSVVSTERNAGWAGTFDFGFNYLLHKNLKLDCGVNRRVAGREPDWNPFVGVTWRY
jgi:hypothetical protein